MKEDRVYDAIMWVVLVVLVAFWLVTMTGIALHIVGVIK